MGLRDDWSVQLSIVFGVVVASFLGATLFTQWQLVAVGRASQQIADRFAPGIEHLARARGEMRRLQLVLRDEIDGTASRSDVENARAQMDDALAMYIAAPDHTPEPLRTSVIRGKDELGSAVDRCLAQRRRVRPDDPLLRDVTNAADALSTAITRNIENNASQSHASAVHIEQAYTRARWLAALMAVLCVLITAFGATALRRAFRAHTRLATQHRELVEARASELEEFAGRVAHDILSPLSIVNMAMRVASTGPNEAVRVQLAERGSAAIKRIDRLVTGLLAFAVAGAKPQEGAAADVGAVIRDLTPELQTSAKEARVDLHVVVETSSSVACDPGVLTSIVSNLAHNAIKYVAKSETRRVDVRATQERNVVRIEVVDTGPGLPPGLEAHVFEPYVRGKNTSKTTSGIGLGLATVKRITTAHGGVVGVASRPGEGCTFWVELPIVA